MKIVYSKQIYCLLWLIIAVASPFPSLPVQAEDFRVPLMINWQTLQGDWLRTDGNYMIRVEAVGKDGQAMVQYYNPASVHVAKSHTFLEKGLKVLFVTLKDTRYQGSTYTLYYDDKQDALRGIYYHGQLQKSFEVIFLRKPVAAN